MTEIVHNMLEQLLVSSSATTAGIMDVTQSLPLNIIQSWGRGERDNREGNTRKIQERKSARHRDRLIVWRKTRDSVKGSMHS